VDLLYKILICNFNPRSVNNFHRGFLDLGHEIKNYVCEGFNILNETVQQDLNHIIDSFKPDFAFSYGYWKGRIEIDAFCDVLQKRGLPHFYWAFDDPECFEEISLPVARRCSQVFTTVVESIEQYKKNGVKARLLLHGCYPPDHKKVYFRGEYYHDLVLLAHNYNVKWDPDYFSYRFNGINNIIKPIVDKNYDLMVWGLWWNEQDRIYNLPEKNYGSVMPYGKEAVIYSSTKIALGLQTVGDSKSQFSVRTFEVLGCGAFHLSQYSPAIENYFKKGIHMEWSKSPAETLELLNFYLNNYEARKKIAQEGQKEVYAKHTLIHRAQEAIGIIKKYL